MNNSIRNPSQKEIGHISGGMHCQTTIIIDPQIFSKSDMLKIKMRKRPSDKTIGPIIENIRKLPGVVSASYDCKDEYQESTLTFQEFVTKTTK